MIHLLLLFIFFTNIYATIENERLTITLNNTNLITIKGVINTNTASKFIYDLNQRDSKNDIIVYLDTPGGDVMAGTTIIDEIQKYNLNCFAQQAISMGFIIFQSCNFRYINSFSVLMQHQMTYNIHNEKLKVENYVHFISQIYDHLEKLQTSRLNIDNLTFQSNTANEWWLYGTNIIQHNCADQIINIKCSSALTNETYTEETNSYIYTFSNCPLITSYIHKKKIKNNDISKDYILYI